MKRLMACLIILNIMIVGCWVYFSDDYSVAARDAASGVTVRQDSPENTVSSLYELIFTSPAAAATLFYDPSSEFTEDDVISTYGDGSTIQIELVKLYTSATNRDYAVVGTVLRVTADGETQVIVEALTMQRVGNRWYIVGDASVPDMETYYIIYELAYDMSATVYSDTVDGLSEDEAASVREQAGTFAINLQQGLESILLELNS